MPWDVVVIGAGAAGLLAAIRTAERGLRTLLVEKNRKPGVKILMSGGARCNLTHATDARGIIEAFGQQGKFLHSALAALGPQDLVDMFEAEGVATKVEPTGKIFPVSNKAIDVLDALLRRLKRSGAEIALAEPVSRIDRNESGFRITSNHRVLDATNLILTTGGQSYPGCGTTGDGYAWAKALGHTIVLPRPALVPITSAADWLKELQGITLPDVSVCVLDADENRLAQRRGSFLFTHFGLSGPSVMDVSRAITDHANPTTLRIECDFLPDMREPELDAFLREESIAQGKKQLALVLAAQLPRRLCDVLIIRAGLPVDRKAAALSKTDRGKLVDVVKHTPIPVTGTLGFPKAEVTAGGVALNEVDSRTMQSKRVPRLYLAGEILDLDGPIGGYNFQSAFSTGWLAGGSVASSNNAAAAR